MKALRNSILCVIAIVWLTLVFQRDEGNRRKSASAVLAKSPPQNAVLEKPICGLPDDKQIHLPPTWDTFVSPRKGEGYVDPIFGCSVKRLTDSSRDETGWDGKHVAFMNYYSTLTALNATDSMLFVLSDDGNWRIKNVNGDGVVPTTKMPAFSGHPVWDASDSNIFYYASGNSLYKATIGVGAVTSTALHKFGEYSWIVSPDAADLSQDGDHVALVGQNANDTMDVFVWSISHQSKTSVYKTACIVDGNINGSAQPGCIHKLQLTADNMLTIQFLGDGSGAEQGVRFWNGRTLVHMQDKTDHYDTGYDLNGKSVFIASNNSSTLSGLTNPCASGWGVDVRQLGNLPSAACLLDHQPYWHVSYRGSSSQPWVTLSFFDDRKSGPELFATHSKYEKPNATNWKAYEGEIVLAKIDGSAVYRLAHARSRSAENYWAQPRAAVSRDGKYVVFTSNMAFSNGCPNDMHVGGECSDVYLIKVR